MLDAPLSSLQCFSALQHGRTPMMIALMRHEANASCFLSRRTPRNPGWNPSLSCCNAPEEGLHGD